MTYAKTAIELFVSPHSAVQLNDISWQHIIFILRESALLASYALYAERNGVFELLPAYAKKHLTSAKVTQARLAKQVLFESTKLHSLFIKHDLPPPIFLKGAAYTIVANGAAAGRIYSDIDVLVAKAELTEIEKLLILEGWMPKVVDDYDERYYRNWAHEIPPMKHAITGTVIDVHHNIVPPVSGRAPDIKHFAQSPNVSESGCYVLSLPGMILHSSIHLVLNEDFTNGFRDLLDLRELFNELSEQSYFDLLDLAAKTGFSRELFYVVRYLQLVLSADLNKEVIKHLNDSSPSQIKLRFADFAFLNAFSPNHALTDSFKKRRATQILLIRGHLKKMPFFVLCYHSIVKSFIKLRSYLLGKTSFEE